MNLKPDECPHGMGKKAACVDCMMDGPVAPPRKDVTQKLSATDSMTARFSSRCARIYGHEIVPGDTIYNVLEIGWCCEQCAE